MATSKLAKLTTAQRLVLGNLADGQRWDAHVVDRRFLGGARSTLMSLQKRGYTEALEITNEGRNALAAASDVKQNLWRAELHSSLIDHASVSQIQYRGWLIDLTPTPCANAWMSNSILSKPAANGVGLVKLFTLETKQPFETKSEAEAHALAHAKERVDAKIRIGTTELL